MTSRTPRREARLPVDLRSVAGNSSRVPPPSSGREVIFRSELNGGNSIGFSNATSVSRSTHSDDVRQLVDSLLELKRTLEEYVQGGVHLEQSTSTHLTSLSSCYFSPQYDVLTAICDVSSRVSDVTARYSYSSLSSTILNGSSRSTSSSSEFVRLPPSELIDTGYVIEHLLMLRPRIDRLARVLARSMHSPECSPPLTPPSAGAGSVWVSSLETVLANVGASVSLAVESLIDSCPPHPYYRSMSGQNGRTRSRHSNRYGRVRRPPTSRSGRGLLG